ncbi:VOC family protein [Aestuariibacter salexigens]|uniref:VOC family protein n=1 Tax=Aestuariibacter salexigens TaxID=226010 RepID=UPI0003F64F8A|nr:VOC family protein [Aestuariibacter salexigens]
MNHPTHIHHINFLVKQLSASANILANILGQSPRFEALPERGVDTATFTLTDTHLVLVSPQSDSGPVADILRQRGEGLFLLSLGVSDLDQAARSLAQQGIHMASTTPRQGIRNWQVWDIDTDAALGPILQLCQQ